MEITTPPRVIDVDALYRSHCDTQKVGDAYPIQSQIPWSYARKCDTKENSLRNVAHNK